MEENKIIDERITKILEEYPFLSYGRMLEIDYIGIVQNSDKSLISIYLMDLIPSEEARKRFLEKAIIWWWESNRTIPINIFLQGEFKEFRPYIRHFSRKDFELISGPIVSLQETIAKRVRKRQITLIRKPID